jgi:predicted anti-sigma-YlaC factor YlaD
MTPPCEAIQIAHEMHVHGAPAELSAGDVEQHVTTCADCRTYVAESKRIDAMNTYLVPEFEFARMRADVIDVRLPRLRRELLLGAVGLAAVVVYGFATRTWLAPVVTLVALVGTWRGIDQRSRRLERAMLAGGRELLTEMRADLRAELATTENWAFVWPLSIAGSALWFGFTRDIEPLVFFVTFVAGATSQWLHWRARKRELESLG